MAAIAIAAGLSLASNLLGRGERRRAAEGARQANLARAAQITDLFAGLRERTLGPGGTVSQQFGPQFEADIQARGRAFQSGGEQSLVSSGLAGTTAFLAPGQLARRGVEADIRRGRAEEAGVRTGIDIDLTTAFTSFLERIQQPFPEADEFGGQTALQNFALLASALGGSGTTTPSQTASQPGTSGGGGQDPIDSGLTATPSNIGQNLDPTVQGNPL